MAQVYQQGVVQAGRDSLILWGMFCQFAKRKQYLKLSQA